MGKKWTEMSTEEKAEYLRKQSLYSNPNSTKTAEDYMGIASMFDSDPNTNYRESDYFQQKNQQKNQKKTTIPNIQGGAYMAGRPVSLNEQAQTINKNVTLPTGENVSQLVASLPEMERETHEQAGAMRIASELSPWTKENEARAKELRDQLSKKLWIISNPDEASDVLQEYQTLISRRDPSNINATESFMPYDPISMSRSGYLGFNVVSGLGKGLESIKNFGIDAIANFAAANAHYDATQQANSQNQMAFWGAGEYVDYPTYEETEETRQALLDWGQNTRSTGWADKLNEQEALYNVKPRTFLGIAGDVAEGVAGMAPAIGANMIVPGSGAVVMFSSAAGSATSEALEAGADYETAFVYGVTSGAIEAATEKITGGIPGLNAGWLDNLTNRTITKLSSNPFSRYLMKMGTDALGEGFEEWLSEAAGQYLVRIYDESEREKSITDTWVEGQEERLYSALIGALSSLAMRSATTSGKKIDAYNAELNAQQARQGMIDALRQDGKSQSEAEIIADQLIQAANSGGEIPEINAPIDFGSDARNAANSSVQSTLTSLLENSSNIPRVSIERQNSQIATPVQPQIQINETAQTNIMPDSNSQQTGDLTPFADATANEIASMVTGEPVEVFEALTPTNSNTQLTNDGVLDDTINSNIGRESNGTASRQTADTRNEYSILGRSLEYDAGGNRLLAEGGGPVSGVLPGGRNVGSGSSILAGGGRLTDSVRRRLNDSGVTDFGFETTENHEAFIRALDAAKASNKNGAAVDSKNLEDLQSAVAFMNREGTAGGAVESNGNITAVFKNYADKRSGAGVDAIINAVARGGNKLDCYGTELVKIYSRAGFEPVARVAYEPGINPEMDAQVLRQITEGKITSAPDIYFMKLRDGMTVDGIADQYKNGSYQTYTKADLDALPLMEYGDAERYRDSLITSQTLGTTDSSIGRDFGGNTVGAAQRQEGSYYGLINEYGALPPGENPNGVTLSRTTDVPAKTAPNAPVRLAARTIMESDIPDEFVQLMEDEIAKGSFSYFVNTNKAAMKSAQNTIKENGYDKALSIWENATRTKKVTPDMNTKERLEVAMTSPGKDQIALGIQLYKDALAAGNYNEAMRLAMEIAAAGTDAGQSAQAISLIKRATPQGQLYYTTIILDRLNNQLNAKYPKGNYDIQISPELQTRLLQSQSEAEIDSAMDAIKQEIADQVPATWIEKWNEWRYLAMLGNAKTHIRNLAGNAVMYAAQRLKNTIAAGIENAVIKDGERSTSILSGKKDRALLDFAYNDYPAMAEIVSGDSKYSNAAIAKDIQQKRQIFKTKPIEWARKFNSKALDVEDQKFSERHYALALAQYMKANNLTPEFLNSGTKEAAEWLSKARSKAISEAQKATFREASKLASTINSLKNSNKAADILLNGLVPFTKTPINILKTGVDYSPIGLARGLWEASTGIKSGKYTATEVIDRIASGLTGSAIVGLGALMKSLDWITGAPPENKKEKEALERTGWQEYSLHIGDSYYSIDWLAPVSMPLFVGVALGESLENDEIDANDIATIISKTANPMFEMSMLQGIMQAFESASYGTNAAEQFANAAGAIGRSYLTQAVPTFARQIATTIDPTRRETYVTGEAEGIQKELQLLLNQTISKLPVASSTLEPYVDEWGRTEESGNILSRTIENFLSPGYSSTEENTIVDDIVNSIYDVTGDTGAFPSKTAKSLELKFDGESQRLTAEQRTEYATTRGQVSFDLIEELSKNEEFKSLDQYEQLEIVKDVYELAKYAAQDAVGADTSSGWQKKAYELEEIGIPMEEFLMMRYDLSNISGDGASDRKRDEIMNSAYSAAQKEAIDNALISSGETKVDYSSQEAYQISQMTDSAQSKYYSIAKPAGMSYEEFVRCYEAFYSGGNRKKQQGIQNIINSGFSQSNATWFYENVIRG